MHIHSLLHGDAVHVACLDESVVLSWVVGGVAVARHLQNVRISERRTPSSSTIHTTHHPPLPQSTINIIHTTPLQTTPLHITPPII